MAQFHLNSKKYTLADNFLTSNCYSCMELNAQSLILCIAYLKHNDMPELFLPHLYESQPCESIFRQFRSFTPTYSTVANCTLKEAESRISKIQLQNDIINEISPFFVYPRLAKLETQTNNETTVTAELPTNTEILNEIEKCERDAIATACELVLIINNRQKFKVTAYTCSGPVYNACASEKRIKEKQTKKSIYIIYFLVCRFKF